MYPNDDLSAWNLGGSQQNMGGYPTFPGGFQSPLGMNAGNNAGFAPSEPQFPHATPMGPYNSPGDIFMGNTSMFPDTYNNQTPFSNFPDQSQSNYTGMTPGSHQPFCSPSYPGTDPVGSQTGFNVSYPNVPSTGDPAYKQPCMQGSFVQNMTNLPNTFDPYAPVIPPNHLPQQISTGFKTPGFETDPYAPTLKPHSNFNPTEDCERLRKAMKGLGTDEQAIIDIMGYRTADQRAKIVQQFKTMYGKDLIKEFRSELSGHFGECVEALCYSLVDFDAVQLRKAVKGAGTDEDALIEILCTRSNEQIRQIKEAYKTMYPGHDLEKDVMNDTSRHFKRVMISLLQANREEGLTVDRAAAKRDAEELYRAGEKRMGTDESKFNMILATKSFAHLRAVFQEYASISKHDIEKALKSEMSGDLLKAMLAIVRCIENKQKYFALMLKKSMKGLGTKDKTLIRLVVSRCEVDMGLIKEEFVKMNGKTLESWITDDTTGHYRKLLLALVSG